MVKTPIKRDGLNGCMECGASLVRDTIYGELFCPNIRYCKKAQEYNILRTRKLELPRAM